MFCGSKVFCADRRCELCRATRRSLILLLMTASAVFAAGVIALVLLLGCGPELGARPCEALKHRDSTGHAVYCDCTCSDDPRFACPADVVECRAPELEERPWYESSGDEGGSSDGSE